MNFILIIIFLVVLLAYIRVRYNQLRFDFRKLPPLLPNGRFFFGHYGQLDFKKPDLGIGLMGVRYRCEEVFTLTLFGRLIVVLNSHNSICQLACSKRGTYCSGRPAPFLLQLLTNNQRDLVYSLPNPKWSQARRTFHKFFVDMRRIHEGRSFGECVFSDQWPHLYDTLANNKTATDTFEAKIYQFQINLMTLILFGEDVCKNENLMGRISKFSKRAERLVKNLYKIMLDVEWFESTMGGSQSAYVIELRLEANRLMDEILNARQSRKSTSSSEICVPSLLDLFQQCELFEREYLKNILVELLLASGHTIVSPLVRFAHLLANNSALQDMIYDNLNEPDYVRSIVFEILRYFSTVPLGIFRQTLCEFQLIDYVLPENTIVIANIHRVHRDPKVFQSPNEFKPSRFLNADKVKCLLAFGCGRRVCPGKSLAIELLALYVKFLLLNFRFQVDARKQLICTNRFSSTAIKSDEKRVSDIKSFCTDRDSLIRSVNQMEDNILNS